MLIPPDPTDTPSLGRGRVPTPRKPRATPSPGPLSKTRAGKGEGERKAHSPKILIHGFEEEFVVVDGPVAEDIFEIGQRDFLRRHGQLHQVGGLLFINVIDDFCLRHGRRKRGG